MYDQNFSVNFRYLPLGLEAYKPLSFLTELLGNVFKYVSVELATSTYIFHRDSVRTNQVNNDLKREEGKWPGRRGGRKDRARI